MDINECFKILELGTFSLDKLDEQYKMIAEEHRGDLDYLMKIQTAYDILKSGNYDMSGLNRIAVNRYATECKERRLASKPHEDGEMENMAKNIILKEASKCLKDRELDYFRSILTKEEFIFSNINNYRAIITIVNNINDGVDIDTMKKYLKAGIGDINYKFLLSHIEYIIDNQDVIDAIYEISGVEEIKVVNKM